MLCYISGGESLTPLYLSPSALRRIESVLEISSGSVWQLSQFAYLDYYYYYFGMAAAYDSKMDGIRHIGDGLLEVAEERLKEFLVEGSISDLYDVEQTPFAR